MANALVFDRVDFTYETMTIPLFQSLSFHLSSGWTGVVGANGSGKTTLLKLSTGILAPDTGHIELPVIAVYCPQRTEIKPSTVRSFLVSYDREAVLLRDRLKISENSDQNWHRLSHGERKRIQIADALWRKPDLLALDEPTNHLDTHAATLIANALHAYKGIGLLVSHDRQLLDALCKQCIFIDARGVQIRPGGVSQGRRVLISEAKAEDKKYRVKKKEIQRLQSEIKSRRALAAGADKKRSKKGLALKDHDARTKKDAARLTGKDGVAGRRQKQLSGRVRKAEAELEGLRFQKEYASGIWLPGAVSPKKTILALGGGSIGMGPVKQLIYPDLHIAPTDRIGFTGKNGFGKSTFLNHVVKHLRAPKENIVFLPQEIDAKNGRNMLIYARRLSGEKLGRLMTIISRLGSLPERLLESRQPSPGESRKLLLALGMSGEPHIIIMDEPTNHMDLFSIECLEAALADCPCCLLLVSHDQRFLKKLTRRQWTIHRDRAADNRFVLKTVG